MKKSLKFAGALTAASMIAAPLTLAPSASFAATTHGDHYAAGKSFGKQVAMYGKYRDGKAGRHSNYTGRMHRPAPRFEKIGFEKHWGFVFHTGHWQWQVNHWNWIAGVWLHR